MTAAKRATLELVAAAGGVAMESEADGFLVWACVADCEVEASSWEGAFELLVSHLARELAA